MPPSPTTPSLQSSFFNVRTSFNQLDDQLGRILESPTQESPISGQFTFVIGLVKGVRWMQGLRVNTAKESRLIRDIQEFKMMGDPINKVSEEGPIPKFDETLQAGRGDADAPIITLKCPSPLVPRANRKTCQPTISSRDESGLGIPTPAQIPLINKLLSADEKLSARIHSVPALEMPEMMEQSSDDENEEKPEAKRRCFEGDIRHRENADIPMEDIDCSSLRTALKMTIQTVSLPTRASETLEAVPGCEAGNRIDDTPTDSSIESGSESPPGPVSTNTSFSTPPSDAGESKSGRSSPASPQNTAIWPADIDPRDSAVNKVANFRPPPARHLRSENVSKKHTPVEVQYVTHLLTLDADLVIFNAHEYQYTRYFVSSHILLHASPRLRNFVREIKKAPPQEIYIQGYPLQNKRLWRMDSSLEPQSLHLILKILHNCPLDPVEHEHMDRSFNELRSLAIICKSYGLVYPVALWKARWKENLVSKFELEKISHEDCLFMLEVFDEGREFDVDPIIDSISHRCSSISDCETYVLDTDTVSDIALWPKHHLKEIMHRREELVAIQVNELRKFVRDFLGMKEKGLLKDYCESEICYDLACGSLLRSVRESGLWPLLNYAEEWHGSSQGLWMKIDGVSFVTLNAVVPEHTCELEGMDVRAHI